MARRALVIGINNYVTDPLRGCVSDADAMAALLRRHADGDLNWDVTVLTDATAGDEGVTFPVLRQALLDLFDAADGTDVLLYFAGHAVKQGWGSELLARDLQGFAFDALMRLVNETQASSVSVILDSCVSGDLANVAMTRSMSGHQSHQEPFRVPRAEIREGAAILTASRGYELAAETVEKANGDHATDQRTAAPSVHGAFTRLLISGLTGAVSDIRGRVTMLSLYDYASELFGVNDQRPLLKANVSTPTVIRLVSPPVTKPQLRELPSHFTMSDSSITLTMAHEGGEDFGSPKRGKGYIEFVGRHGHPASEEQKLLDLLKVLRNAGLVTGDADFYFLCENTGTVRLTPLGEYYWQLAAQNRV